MLLAISLVSMFAGAFVVGLTVGKTAKRLLVGFGITLLCALPLVLLAVFRISLLKATLIGWLRASGRLVVDNAPMSPQMLAGTDIPVILIWSMIAILAALALLVYLFSFNCRKNAGNIYVAVGGAILAGGVFFFCSIWGFYGFAAFIMIFGESVALPLNSGLLFTAALTAVMLVAWTVLCFMSKRTGWKILLARIAMIAGVYAFIWLAALPSAYFYARYAKGEAEKAAVLPTRIAENFPAGAQDDLEILSGFQQDHQDFELPYQVFVWRPDESTAPDRIMPPEKREYTLKIFDSPDFAEYCRARESLLQYSASAGKDVLYFPALRNARDYARICAGKAAVYHETGKPEKILPELMKLTRLDEDTLGNSEFLIVELVRIACRGIWYKAMVQLGPNDRAYAPVYREALDFMKSRKIHLPVEAGYYLRMLSGDNMRADEAKQSGEYAALLSRPLRMALAAKGILNALALREVAASWEKGNIPDNCEAGKDDVASSLWKAARHERASIIFGTTALALKLYRCEHGKYPDKLEALVPQYLEKNPECPYSGKPLTYESDGNDFSLSYENADGHEIKLDSRPKY